MEKKKRTKKERENKDTTIRKISINLVKYYSFPQGLEFLLDKRILNFVVPNHESYRLTVASKKQSKLKK